MACNSSTLTLKVSSTALIVNPYSTQKELTWQAFVYGLHHSSKYWDAPEAYRPERWLAPVPAVTEQPAPAGALRKTKYWITSLIVLRYPQLFSEVVYLR